MNKNINLCEILKGHAGETFWSPLVGNITYKEGDGGLVFFQYGNSVIDIPYHGKDMDNNIAVFPSKDQRDWNKWIEKQNSKVPKTWGELVNKKDYFLEYKDIKRNNFHYEITEPSAIEKSALALLKIHQLIEVGYGGNVTNEEWKNIDKYKYIISATFHVELKMHFCSKNHIAFHTKEQIEEFLKYPENVQLLKDYFQIN